MSGGIDGIGWLRKAKQAAKLQPVGHPSNPIGRQIRLVAKSVGC
jgi:hypothetical protein